MPSDDAVAIAVDRESAAAPHHQLELRTWLRTLTCVRLIEVQIKTRLRAEFDTTLPRFDVLAQLDAARGSLTMGELSARLMVTSGNVTGLIDAMEREGLVSRQPHPTDRRSTLIRTTEAGRALFARMAPAHADWLAELMAGLSRGETQTLLVLLGRLKEGLLREQSTAADQDRANKLSELQQRITEGVESEISSRSIDELLQTARERAATQRDPVPPLRPRGRRGSE